MKDQRISFNLKSYAAFQILSPFSPGYTKVNG